GSQSLLPVDDLSVGVVRVFDQDDGSKELGIIGVTLQRPQQVGKELQGFFDAPGIRALVFRDDKLVVSIVK
ncbi:hypothetical protein, partial [Gulosibacter bifidus]|uniref:hypothetical protein n=1 Tax=Gulosibacter bifidus TaxID=272239 RepID=UPI000A708568